MKPSVLVIEDNAVQSKLLKMRLEKLGYSVSTAATAAHATELLKAENFDFALCDWNLPDMSGVELIKSFQSYTEDFTPFIMLTAYTEPERIRVALESGAFDFLKKPACPVELEARIASALRYRDLQKRYLEMAVRDPLTGLHNRRYLDEKISSYLTSNQTDDESEIVLAIVDIDFFKKINDNYGHDVGDQVLVQMARLLTGNLRERDIVCRFGGEEFVLVFKNCDLKNAHRVMERLLNFAHKRPWGNRQNSFAVTFSCGVVSAREGDYDFDKMLKLADEQLYWAKEHGRDQIVTSARMCRRAT